jgi:rare lipoprotein A
MIPMTFTSQTAFLYFRALVVGGIAFLIGVSSAYGYPKEKPHFSGKANFYSAQLHGHRTASGANYDHSKLTAAHRNLPFGTKVKLVNRKNSRSCVVEINDRGPFTPGRVIDVSGAAAKKLGLTSSKDRVVDGYILKSRR